ncbi:MAG: 2-amino-4-hydroxy-6-hydroxymethyldihydropteridine diphosphokinase, partial [Candidatus Muiribacteriota bacterium]
MNKKNFRVLFLLGSNKGDSAFFLKEARNYIEKELGDIYIQGLIKCTKPVGVVNQNNFLNQLIGVKSTFSPETILKKIKIIEKEIGRSTTHKWGEREIDIDILFFEDYNIENPDLKIPHHQVYTREFVKEMVAALG